MTTPGDETTELELVALATRGELGAFEQLVARYQRAVFSIALYKSKNYFDAEDLTQDVFLAAFKALPTLKTPESFGAWLFGIAYNRCNKWYRRERQKIVKIEAIKQKAAQEERLRRRDAVGPLTEQGTSSPGQVSEILRRLPREVGEALTLKYLDGLSYQEIGARLGINAHRIDYLIRKGKQMIRERLGWKREGVSP